MARRPAKARRHAKARPQGILEVTSRGFGFVKTAEGEFFIPASKLNGAFPGDLVEVSRISSQKQDELASYVDGKRQRPTGRVARVVMREQRTIVGRYEVADPFGVVVPDDPNIPYDIFTLRKDAPHVSDGDVVEVEMTEYPSRNSAATGRILRVIGSEEEGSVEIDRIIGHFKLETQFSDAALAEAEALRQDIAVAEGRGYRRINQELVFTIDPVDARDYDDAVSCTWDGKYWHLGVYIADVSAFVEYGSSLDLAARRRASSVYLVDRVLPMLPEKISNNLCSLVPGKARQAIAVQALIRADGQVEGCEVFPAVICSRARLSYEQALALLEAAPYTSASGLDRAVRSCEMPTGALPLDENLLSRLKTSIEALSALAEKQFFLRYQAGCMDFERTEAKVRLDDAGTPVEVRLRKRNRATHAIEEAMILANRLVARYLIEHSLPCVFRVHDAPDGEALYALYQILVEMPEYKDLDEWAFCSGRPKVLQDVLARAKGRPEHELISLLLLRSMKRAVYSTEDRSHFGVALEHYCHFTSPIRRYPDLLVHRMLKVAFFGETETSGALKKALPWMAEHSSKMERIADKAAYQSQQFKLVEYMQRDIGSTFEGVISGVSTFGLFVQLPNTAVGHLPLRELSDEHFSFDPDRYVLTGVDSGIRYQLGQRISVVLIGAHPRERRLSLRLSHRV